MKNTTPKIPIKLPTNSTVFCMSPSNGAHNHAIKAPTTIIGIPTPKLISLEAMINAVCKMYMKFMKIMTKFGFSQVLILVH